MTMTCDLCTGLFSLSDLWLVAGIALLIGAWIGAIAMSVLIAGRELASTLPAQHEHVTDEVAP